MNAVARISRFVGNTFAAWIALAAVAGYLFPAQLAPLARHVVPLLGIVMFGMGLTLSAADFREVLKRPRDVLLGVVVQYTIMPLLALALAKGLRLPPEVAVGVILVGSCPGGTASNVMTYLARGDVPLSVTMTSCTTLLAPVVTPALMLLLAREWIPVDAGALFWSIVNVVIVPIVLGLVVKGLFKRQAEAAVTALPLVSVAAIVAIVAGVVAANQPRLATSGAMIFLVVALHNALGYLLGYAVARLGGLGFNQCKAVAIEVGMQNSGLGAALATAHFTPLAAVPSAIFSVWHNISGALLAAYFRRTDSAARHTVSPGTTRA